MSKSICVFCSSISTVADEFFAAASHLGAVMAQRGFSLIYGGTNVGLMGAVAESVHQHGGWVVGIIPESLHQRQIAYADADELIVTRDMRERKSVMESKADAFVALPGGFGTLEEVFEVITLKQLNYHQKPIVLLNINGFYHPLQGLFDHIYAEGFAREDSRHLYHMVPEVSSLFEYLEVYQPPKPGRKWA